MAQGHEMLSARAALRGKPILDGPLAGARPPHDGLGRLVGAAEVLPQRRSNCRCVVYLGMASAVSIRKNLALFRKHLSASPQLS